MAHLNRNRRIVRELALQAGATKITWTDGRRHTQVRVEMPGGKFGSWTVAHHPQDPHKLEGWTRQKLRQITDRPREQMVGSGRIVDQVSADVG